MEEREAAEREAAEKLAEQKLDLTVEAMDQVYGQDHLAEAIGAFRTLRSAEFLGAPQGQGIYELVRLGEDHFGEVVDQKRDWIFSQFAGMLTSFPGSQWDICECWQPVFGRNLLIPERFVLVRPVAIRRAPENRELELFYQTATIQPVFWRQNSTELINSAFQSGMPVTRSLEGSARPRNALACIQTEHAVALIRSRCLNIFVLRSRQPLQELVAAMDFVNVMTDILSQALQESE